MEAPLWFVQHRFDYWEEYQTFKRSNPQARLVGCPYDMIKRPGEYIVLNNEPEKRPCHLSPT